MRTRSTELPISWPPRRFAIRAVIMALVLTLIIWYFGVDLWHALLLGVVVTTVSVSAWVLTNAEVHPDSWGGGAARRRGARHDVTELSWLMRGHWGRMDLAAELRVRRIARQRLAARGLELENRAHRGQIERLLGARVYAQLTGSGRARVGLRSLVDCLDALDRLDPVYYPSPRRRVSRLSLLRNRLRGRRTL